MTEKDTDNIGRRFKSITTDLKLYIEKRVELLLLNIGEQLSRWIAESIQKLSGVLLIVGGLIFLLVALSVYLGNVLNSPWLGYVIVSVPLLLMGIFFFYLKPQSMLKSLQDHFESELIEALTAKRTNEDSLLDLPETTKEEKL